RVPPGGASPLRLPPSRAPRAGGVARAVAGVASWNEDPRRADGRSVRGGGGHAPGPRARARDHGRRRRSQHKEDMATKYIFVTGGVVSSLGKGLASASIGALLEGH